MNNQIRWVGFFILGIFFAWGIGAVNAQSLGTPTNLTLVDAEPFAVTLSWEDNAVGESHHIVTVRQAGLLIYEAFIAENITSARIDGLSCNTSYSFRVYAHNQIEYTNSGESNIVTASTEVCPPPPAAPTNLAFVDAEQFTITVSWTASASYESYYFFEVNYAGYWYEHAYVEAGNTSFAIDGLLCNTSYDIRMRAYRVEDYSYSDYSNVITASTEACPPPPAAPSNFHLINTTQLTATVGWTDNSSDEIYFVMERQLADLSWQTVTNIPANQSSTSSSGFSCNTTYTFRLAAVNQGGNSAYTDPLVVTTNACASPVAPSNLIQTGNTQTSVSLSWTDNELDETNYRIERSSDGTTGWTQITSLSANTTSYTVSSLACSNTYYFRVRAYRSTGNIYSAYSNTITGTTAACIPPNAPSDLILTGQNQFTVSMSWTDNAVDETHYQVERSANSGTSWTQLSFVSANTTSYQATNLTCGTNYQFRVRARRGIVYSGYSNVISVTTSCAAPVPVSELTASSVTDFTVTLSWVDNDLYETVYGIQRSTNGSSWTLTQAAANSTGTTISGLNCATTYYFRIRTEHPNDVVAVSNTITATTATCPPPPSTPTDLTITGTSSSTVSLSWTDNAINETVYRIQRSGDNGTSWADVGTVAKNITSYTSTGLSCELNYQFRVYAYRSNDNVNSDYSNVVNIALNDCVPPAPSNLTNAGKTQTTIDLVWTDNSTSETSYRLERSYNGTNWTQIAELPANSTSYQDTGLTCSTLYWYRIRTHRSSDNVFSPYSTNYVPMSGGCPLITPSNFRITSRTTSSLNLAWDDTSSNESGYRIERSLDGGISWTQIADRPANTTSYQGAAISCVADNIYRVYSYRSGGFVSPYSDTVTAFSIPCTPAGLTRTGGSYYNISLSWTDNAYNESEYRLERSDDAGVSWNEIAVLPANTTSYDNTGLNCGTGYRYRVRAYRSSDNFYTPYTAVLTAVTTTCPPPVPSNVTTSIGNSWVNLSWTYGGATNFTSLQIERSLDGGTSWTNLAWYNNITILSHSDSALMCETSFMYRLRTARWTGNGYDYSAYTEPITATTAICPPPPVAPTNLTATPVGFQIQLSWQDNEPHLAQYRIQYSTNGGTSWSNFGGLISDDGTMYIAGGLTCSTDYSFRMKTVRTVPIAAESEYSNVATARSWECDPPETPTNLTAVAASRSLVNLSWLDNGTDETYFFIERSEDGGLSFIYLDTVAANTTSYGNADGYSIRVLCGRTYHYRIRSYRSDLRLYSDWSNVASATTPSCLPTPTPPTNLLLVSNNLDGVTLSWTDNSSTEDYFLIERSTDGVNWDDSFSVPPNETSFTDTWTFECTLFYYRVFAKIHGVTPTTPTNVVSVVSADCPPAAPSNFTATMVNLTTISLSWVDNAVGETEYELWRYASGTSQEFTLPANSTSFTDTGISCGKSYEYNLRAYRAEDNYLSDLTTVSITMPACPATPAAPSNLMRTIISPTEISLTWDDNATNETNYRVERSTDPNGLIWNTIADLGANAESYSDTTVECGTNYRYRVMAYIAEYNVFSWDSMSVWVRPLCAPNLSVEFSTNWSIGLSWNSVAGATDYRIERSSDGGSTWQTVHETEFGETSYRDAALDCGMSYQYRVSAYRSSDDVYGNPSNVMTGSTNPCTITETTCTFNQLDLSSYNVDTLGPLYMSGDGSRLAFNYYNDTVDMYPDGLYLYDIASESVIADFPNAAFGDINSDGSRLVFMSSDNPLGQNADGGEEIFYWNNGTMSQLTDTSLATGVGQPHMSDDGSIVVFWGDGDIVGDATVGSFVYIWDATNGIRKLIPQVYGANAADLDIAISGDGSTVVFEHSKSLSGLSGLGNVQLYRWNASDGLQLIHAYEAPQSFDVFLMSLMINEDGSRIVFTDSNDPLGLNGGEDFEIFIWDESTGLRQLTEADSGIVMGGWDSWLGSIDASGSRILFISGQNLDTDDSSPIESGVYLYDEGYGFSNIYPATSFGMPVWGSAVSADGLRMAVPLWVGYPGTGNGWSYVEIFVVDCTPANHLPLPNSLSAVADGADGMDLSWTDNSLSEDEYRIERSTDGTNWTEIAQLAANSTSYSDSGLECETEYQYRVRGYRAWDEHYSDYSNVAIESSALSCVDAPTGLIITGTSQTSISLSWTDNAADETSYSLERSADGVNWLVIQALAANTTSFTDITTICNTTYDYRIRAYRSGDNQYSSYSNVATGATTACPPPTAPTGLTVSNVGHTNISLAWTDNASDETSYSLERSADGGASWAEIAQPAANATSYNDTTALCNTSYDYRVRAYRAGDNQFSDYSNVVTGTSGICITLNAPTNIQVTGSTETGMSLSWTDNSTNESGYEIERSLDGTNWVLLSSLPADSTSYTDSGLSCSTGYQYRVRSNHLGTGAYSPYGSSGVLTTASCPALVASVLSSTGATQNSISLSWTVDTNGTSFTLAYYNGTSWVNLGIFASTTTSYTHTGLICGRSYQYQITTYRAADAASVTSSAFSTSTAACPPLDAPNAPLVVNTEPALVSLQIPAMPATATNMSLERSSDGLSWTSLGAASSTYLDTAVVCGSSYQYRLVASRSSDGMTSTSAIAVAFTDACPIPTVLGVYRGGLWVFVGSNNTATPVNSFNFGDNAWQPFVGDWDGDGIDGVGLYRNGEFALRNIASADSPEQRFNFGSAEAGWTALVGDWDGNGTDTVGLYKDGLFILSNDNANIQYRFNYGQQQAGWQAVAGDWDGNGADGIGLYKDGLWMLANDVNNPDGTSLSINYGPNQAGWTAIVGDWNGDGMDSIGLYSNGTWRMRVNSVNDATESSLSFGQTGDIPLAIFEN